MKKKDFNAAYERLAKYVLPGGLMIEGTSTPFGNLWAASAGRGESAQWSFEALIFSTNFHSGFKVEEFQTILPKNYVHRVVSGEPIHDFFEAWKRSAAETASAKTFGLKQWFTAAAKSLAKKGFDIDLHKKWLGKGYLLWYL